MGAASMAAARGVDEAVSGWAAVVLVLLLLLWLAYNFRRPVYRVGAILVLAASIMLALGLHEPGGRQDVVEMARTGGNRIADVLLPLSKNSLGSVGWLAIGVILATVLALLELLCARREPISVTVSLPPADEKVADRTPEVEICRRLSVELRFLLPAVQVLHPGGMPGTSTLDSIAAIGSESEVEAAKQAALLVRAIRALAAKPRSREVRLFVQRCDESGTVTPDGCLRLVILDVRDARSGKSLLSMMSKPEPEAVAAEWAAAVVARHVLAGDPSTPKWALGSADGDDLRAYLLARATQPNNHTFPEVRRVRQVRRRMLEDALANSRDGGVMRYELAGMYDIDGEHVKPLLLHLTNRMRYPRFLDSHYRFAMSLSMVAGPGFARHWCQADLDTRRCIARQLDQVGLLQKLERSGGAHRSAAFPALSRQLPSSADLRLIQISFATLAKLEFRACARSGAAGWLLWNAIFHRDERAACLRRLRRRGWRRLLSYNVEAKIGYDLADLRLQILTGAADLTRTKARITQKWLTGLRLKRVLEGRGWTDGRVPWAAIYNTACLSAMALWEGGPSDEEVQLAVQLLRLAVTDRACDLQQPSEWLAMDPDLVQLRARRVFCDLIREKAAQDFTAVDRSDVGDPWFRQFVDRAGPRGWSAMLELTAFADPLSSWPGQR